MDSESGLVYTVSALTFDRLKGTLDRGYGKQDFLTLGHWQCSRQGERQGRLLN